MASYEKELRRTQWKKENCTEQEDCQVGRKFNGWLEQFQKNGKMEQESFLKNKF